MSFKRSATSIFNWYFRTRMSLLLEHQNTTAFFVSFSFPSFYPFHRKNETLVSLYLQINSPVSNMVLGFFTQLLSSVFFLSLHSFIFWADLTFLSKSVSFHSYRLFIIGHTGVLAGKRKKKNNDNFLSFSRNSVWKSHQIVWQFIYEKRKYKEKEEPIEALFETHLSRKIRYFTCSKT